MTPDLGTPDATPNVISDVVGSSIPPPGPAGPRPGPTPAPAAVPTPAAQPRPGESDELTPSQAEAIAKVAAMSAEKLTGGGPSRAVTGALIALGALLVAMLVLAMVVSG